MTTFAQPKTTSPAGMQWRPILLGAILLEVVLFVVLVPIGLAFGMPGAGNGTDYRVFFLAVPFGYLLFGYLFGRWTGRRVASRRALHGVLLGILAFAIYLAVCSIPPNTHRARRGGIWRPTVVAVQQPAAGRLRRRRDRRATALSRLCSVG